MGSVWLAHHHALATSDRAMSHVNHAVGPLRGPTARSLRDNLRNEPPRQPLKMSSEVSFLLSAAAKVEGKKIFGEALSINTN
jgi:hypothetical protein